MADLPPELVSMVIVPLPEISALIVRTLWNFTNQGKYVKTLSDINTVMCQAKKRK